MEAFYNEADKRLNVEDDVDEYLQLQSIAGFLEAIESTLHAIAEHSSRFDGEDEIPPIDAQAMVELWKIVEVVNANEETVA